MEVRSLKKQYEIKDEILKNRLDEILKNAMEASEVDCWLLACKEYAEDPMFIRLTPESFLTARRISILVLFYNGNEVEKYCCNMADEGLEKFYTNVYNPKEESQLEALTKLLRRLNPKKIGIDISSDYAYFSGLTKSMYDFLKDGLPEDVTKKFTSSEDLGIRYCERRSKLEIKYYYEVMQIAKEIMDEAFSDKVIKPGITTTADVEWFMKQKVKSLGLDYWFDPDVNLQNGSSKNPMQNGDTIINKGDLVHCDFGIVYLGLCTDTQRLCYILKDDEDSLPKELEEAYKENLRFHNIVRSSFKEGLTGNEVFKASILEANKQGIKAMLYTHPLGNFGHAPGPTIGLFSNQNEVHPAGDLKVHDDTAYALELNTRKYLDIYKQETFIFTEESVIFTDGELKYLDEPKDTIKLI